MNTPRKLWIFWLSLLYALLLSTSYIACDTKPSPQEKARENAPEKVQETVQEAVRADASPTDQSTPPEPSTSAEKTVDEPPKVTIRASGPTKVLDPSKPGPYQVGVTTIHLVDESRKDPKTGKPRPIVIEVWYPAVDAAKNTPKDVYNIRRDAPPAVQKKIDSLNLPVPVLKQDAHRDAEPLRTEGPYPVILYSHGSGGIRFQSVFQTPHLASHGYVVISPDHHGNTLYDLFLDPNAQDISKLMLSAQNRPTDMKFAMEAIQKRVQTPGDLLYKLASFKKVGMTGHSFGGLTSILVTRILPNVAVIVPQAPAASLMTLLGVRSEHIAHVPAMVLAAQKDNTLEYQKEQKSFYDNMTKDPFFDAERHIVSFIKGGHFTFSNICDLDLKKYANKLGFGNVSNILNDGCTDQNTPIKEAHQLINHYSTAIFNVLLRNSEKTRVHLKQVSTSEIKYESKTPKKE